MLVKHPLHLVVMGFCCALLHVQAEMVLNTDVTQETIEQTICVKGYTKSVRPSAVYTNGVNEIFMRDDGIDASKVDEYQLDHIVSLGLGSPTGTRQFTVTTFGRSRGGKAQRSAGGKTAMPRLLRPSTA